MAEMEIVGAEVPVADPNAGTALDAHAVNKYREAAAIANNVLTQLVGAAVAGKKAVELCAMGDAAIEKATVGLYKSSPKMEKGIALPTCVNVNACVAYYSPLASEDSVTLKAGDAVKLCVGRGEGGRGREGMQSAAHLFSPTTHPHPTPVTWACTLTGTSRSCRTRAWSPPPPSCGARSQTR